MKKCKECSALQIEKSQRLTIKNKYYCSKVLLFDCMPKNITASEVKTSPKWCPFRTYDK